MDVDEMLVKETGITNEHQKYVALVFEIKEDKHSGELMGFVNVTDINEHLSSLVTKMMMKLTYLSSPLTCLCSW